MGEPQLYVCENGRFQPAKEGVVTSAAARIVRRRRKTYPGPLTNSRREAMVKARLAGGKGSSYRELAERFQVSRGMVYKVLAAHGAVQRQTAT